MGFHRVLIARVIYFIPLLIAPCVYSQLVFDNDPQTGRKVNIPPLIEEQPPKQIPFRIGHSIELPCVASGSPQPNYRWLMDDKKFDPSGNDGRVAIQPGVGTLIFANPLQRDEGFYQCIAENVAGKAITIRTFLRRAYLQPFAGVSTRSYQPRLGEPLTLRCVPPLSYPRANVYWAIMEGSRMIPIRFDDRVTVDPEGNLRFANIRSTDRANGNTYACIAQNTETRDIEQGEYARISPQGQNVQYSAPQIVWHTTTNMVALRGNAFTMTCIFSGSPTPVVSWRRVLPRGSELPTTSRIESYGQQLVIESIKHDDEGTYQCTGLNEEGHTPMERSVNVKVEAAPYWIRMPMSLDAAEDGRAEFFCEGGGFPEPEHFWFLNGVEMTKIADDPRRHARRNTLTFTNITKIDAMTIQCNVTNKHDYIFMNAYLNVLREPAVIQEPPMLDQKAAEGQNIQISCRVFGSPKPQIVWKKGSEQLTGGRYRILDEGHLEIMDVSLVDAGFYTCTAENKYGSAEATGNLIVRRRTRIQTAPQDVMVEMNTEAKFTCTATTDPAEVNNLHIDWQKDGQTINYDSAQRIYRNDIDNSLTISGTMFLDTGKYTCLALNGIDEDSASATLTVQEPPDPPNKIVVECKSFVDPLYPDVTRIRAEVSWQPGRDHYAPVLYYKLQFNTTFSADTWYDVLPPVPKRSPNDTTPQAEPLPGILPNATRFDTVLSPWGNYTFRLLARNKVGLSDPSTHSSRVCTTEADVPHKNPDNVIGEGDQPDNLVIFWTPMPKIEHNGPDFKYVVSWYPADNPFEILHETVGRDDAWHHVIRGPLETFKKYMVRVKAKNTKGDARVDAKWVVGYTGEGEPKIAPNDVMVEPDSITATQAILVWTDVDKDEELIRGFFRGYRIQYTKVERDNYEWREVDVIINEGRTLYPRPRYRREIISLNVTLHYRLRNLPPNSLIRIQVRVLNKYFLGPPSVPIEFRTPEGVPGPPNMFDVIARGATYFELGWEEPREKNGKLIGYHISYQIVEGLNLAGIQFRPPLYDPDATNVQLTGLRPNTYYRVFLAASTNAGRGSTIFLDMKTLPAGVPTPATFAVTHVTKKNCTVSWEPSRSGNPGSVFYVQWRPRGGFHWDRSEEEYLASQFVVWPLDPGTVYQVRVVATNGMGDEAHSEYIEVRTEGVFEGRYFLASTIWFWGIWISVILIIVLFVLFILAKRQTDSAHGKKEAEIEEQVRQIQAEEAAMQLGVLNQYAVTGSREMLFQSQPSLGGDKRADRSYDVAEEMDPHFFENQPPQQVEYPPDPQGPVYPQGVAYPQGAAYPQAVDSRYAYDDSQEVFDEPPRYNVAVPVHGAPPMGMTSQHGGYSPVPRQDDPPVAFQLQRSEGPRGSKDTFV